MKTILLSKFLVDEYSNMKLDISYALSELLGCIDYDNCSQIICPPIMQRDAVEFLIDDSVYNELSEKFDGLDGYGEVAELLLWSNYLTGGNL